MYISYLYPLKICKQDVYSKIRVQLYMSVKEIKKERKNRFLFGGYRITHILSCRFQNFCFTILLLFPNCLWILLLIVQQLSVWKLESANQIPIPAECINVSSYHWEIISSRTNSYVLNSKVGLCALTGIESRRKTQNTKTVEKATGKQSTIFPKNSWRFTKKIKRNLWWILIAYILQGQNINEIYIWRPMIGQIFVDSVSPPANQDTMYICILEGLFFQLGCLPSTTNALGRNGGQITLSI